MLKLTIALEIDAEHLMDSVFNNLWISTSPWLRRYAYGEYKEGMKVAVSYDLPEGDEGEGKGRGKVSVDDLLRGLAIVIDKGYQHCGLKVTHDLDEWDACCADLVLQCALMGEVVYG